MTEITVDGLTGSGMTWSADGEPSKSPKAVVIEDGAYKGMQSAEAEEVVEDSTEAMTE